MDYKKIIIIFSIFLICFSCSKKNVTSPEENQPSLTPTFSLFTNTNTPINTFTFTSTATNTPTPYGKIVFTSNLDGDYDIYIYNFTNQSLTNITNSNTGYDGFPSWLLNGTQIYFISDRSAIGTGNDIYVINEDGTNPFEFVGTSADKYYPRNGVWMTNKHMFYYKLNSTSGKYEICAWDYTNSKEVVVLASSQGDFQWCDYNSYVNKIVYTSTTTGYKQIYIANTDGSSSVMLTNELYLHTEPKFSKNGDKLVYSANSNYDNKNEIWIMNIDGTGKTRITYNSEKDRFPCFSPDGYWILYVKYDATDTYGDLYLVPVTGGIEKKLNIGFSNTNETHPDWCLF